MLFKDVNGHLSVSVKYEQMIVDAGTKHENRRNKEKKNDWDYFLMTTMEY